MKLGFLLILVGCGGPSFTGIEREQSAGVAGQVAIVAGAPVVSRAGSGGNFQNGGMGGEGGESSKEGGSGGGTSIGSMGGEGGASTTEGGSGGQAGTAWGCRVSDGLCQCYSDPSKFEVGWLPLDSCPASNLCTNRDNVACVCWDSESSYQNALEISGTTAVDECP